MHERGACRGARPAQRLRQWWLLLRSFSLPAADFPHCLPPSSQTNPAGIVAGRAKGLPGPPLNYRRHAHWLAAAGSRARPQPRGEQAQALCGATPHCARGRRARQLLLSPLSSLHHQLRAHNPPRAAALRRATPRRLPASAPGTRGLSSCTSPTPAKGEAPAGRGPAGRPAPPHPARSFSFSRGCAPSGAAPAPPGRDTGAAQAAAQSLSTPRISSSR
jgi:hypothetical protein